MMKRHRPGAPCEDESSSSDDEDAFASLAREQSSNKKRAKGSDVLSQKPKLGPPSIQLPPTYAALSTSSGGTAKVSEPSTGMGSESSETPNQPQLPVSITSSMKRHHGVLSNARKAKMDSMLQELATTLDSKKNQRESSAFVPNKKGSYVEAGEEESTTNIFIGNLPTHVTEEQLGNLFRQFGDLYSIKIMWPRPGDAMKNRHTGFVCFLRRVDAEAAMHSLDDTDSFACGRRITLRWGKNIIREEGRESVSEVPTSGSEVPTSSQQLRGHQINERPMIQVRWPGDSLRERCISTVADFVARDGSALEKVLMSREAGNPRFDFLFPHGRDHEYYKWRVYAFCQGDHRGVRMAPFSMLEGGCLWVPPLPPTPPSTEDATAVESSAREVAGGGRRRADGGAVLNAAELTEAHQLFRAELCASRSAICRAMAFCFEKTAAAHHVASLLQGLFTMEDAASGVMDTSQRGNCKVSVETLVSRLYLLSDVLFNSQQPGIKHAFLYRSAIESMAPGVFSALGSYSRNQQARGRRWTAHHKLATAVHVVLQAWSSWNVYPPAFLQELQARFEGREASYDADVGGAVEERKEASFDPSDAKPELLVDGETEAPCVLEVAQGQWTAVEDTHESYPVFPVINLSSTDRKGLTDEQDQDGEPLEDDHNERRGDLDGEPVDVSDAVDLSLEDRNGKPLAEEHSVGAPLEEGDPDGEALEEDDPDGEPLDDDDPDGESLMEEDPDGEPIDDADGEPVDMDERERAIL